MNENNMGKINEKMIVIVCYCNMVLPKVSSLLARWLSVKVVCQSQPIKDVLIHSTLIHLM